MLQDAIQSLGFGRFALGIDAVNMIFVIAFVMVGTMGLLYTLASRPPIKRAMLSLVFVLASLGCVTAGNMLTFLIFWELMLIVSYLMIVSAGTARSRNAGFRYLLYHVIAGAGMLVGVLVQVSATGSMAFSAPTNAAIPFFMLGIGIKVGAIPFHTWVPDAYASASPSVSVVLSGFTTKVGVYAIIRLLPGVAAIPYMGAAMALVGVLLALLQKYSRRVLGYSIVSQVGYMVAGVGLATASGIDAGSLHVINHIAYKTLLFMAAGAVIYRVGSDHLPSLGGLIRYMPLTFICALVGALSISGVPPFNGFVSKYWLKLALDGQPVVLHALTIAGIGTGASFMKLLWYTYLRDPENRTVSSGPKEVDPGMAIPMLLLAVFCLATGLRPDILAGYLPHAGPAPDPFTLSGLTAGAWPPVAGVAFFTVARQLLSRAPEPPDVDALYRRGLVLMEYVAYSLARITEDRLQGNLMMILVVFLVALLVFR